VRVFNFVICKYYDEFYDLVVNYYLLRHLYK
jgi:hypothetical protein